MAYATTDLVAVRREVSSTASVQPSANKKAGRMIIAPEGNTGATLIVPYAPQSIDHGDLGAEFVSVPRPGFQPVYVYASKLTPTMSATLIVADKQNVTAISVIQRLIALAQSGQRVRVTYGFLESGVWNIEELSLSSKRRHPVTDEIVQAEVEISFRRASEIQIGAGPVSGGVGPVTGGVKPPTTPAPPKAPSKTTAKYHVVKSGDTLWDLSVKYYKTGTKWRIIADANKIKDPRKLKINTKLRIP